MAFATTLVKRINFGNMRVSIMNITDAQSAGSTVQMAGTVYGVKGLNNTDSSDTFKENAGALSAASTRGQFTLTPVSDNDDGSVWVFHK